MSIGSTGSPLPPKVPEQQPETTAKKSIFGRAKEKYLSFRDNIELKNREIQAKAKESISHQAIGKKRGLSTVRWSTADKFMQYVNNSRIVKSISKLMGKEHPETKSERPTVNMTTDQVNSVLKDLYTSKVKADAEHSSTLEKRYGEIFKQNNVKEFIKGHELAEARETSLKSGEAFDEDAFNEKFEDGWEERSNQDIYADFKDISLKKGMDEAHKAGKRFDFDKFEKDFNEKHSLPENENLQKLSITEDGKLKLVPGDPQGMSAEEVQKLGSYFGEVAKNALAEDGSKGLHPLSKDLAEVLQKEGEETEETEFLREVIENQKENTEEVQELRELIRNGKGHSERAGELREAINSDQESYFSTKSRELSEALEKTKLSGFLSGNADFSLQNYYLSRNNRIETGKENPSNRIDKKLDELEEAVIMLRNSPGKKLMVKDDKLVLVDRSSKDKSYNQYVKNLTSEVIRTDSKTFNPDRARRLQGILEDLSSSTDWGVSNKQRFRLQATSLQKAHETYALKTGRASDFKSFNPDIEMEDLRDQAETRMAEGEKMMEDAQKLPAGEKRDKKMREGRDLYNEGKIQLKGVSTKDQTLKEADALMDQGDLTEQEGIDLVYTAVEKAKALMGDEVTVTFEVRDFDKDISKLQKEKDNFNDQARTNEDSATKFFAQYDESIAKFEQVQGGIEGEKFLKEARKFREQATAASHLADTHRSSIVAIDKEIENLRAQERAEAEEQGNKLLQEISINEPPEMAVIRDQIKKGFMVIEEGRDIKAEAQAMKESTRSPGSRQIHTGKELINKGNALIAQGQELGKTNPKERDKADALIKKGNQAISRGQKFIKMGEDTLKKEARIARPEITRDEQNYMVNQQKLNHLESMINGLAEEDGNMVMFVNPFSRQIDIVATKEGKDMTAGHEVRRLTAKIFDMGQSVMRRGTVDQKTDMRALLEDLKGTKYAKDFLISKPKKEGDPVLFKEPRLARLQNRLDLTEVQQNLNSEDWVEKDKATMEFITLIKRGNDDPGVAQMLKDMCYNAMTESPEKEAFEIQSILTRLMGDPKFAKSPVGKALAGPAKLLNAVILTNAKPTPKEKQDFVKLATEMRDDPFVIKLIRNKDIRTNLMKSMKDIVPLSKDQKTLSNCLSVYDAFSQTPLNEKALMDTLHANRDDVGSAAIVLEMAKDLIRTTGRKLSPIFSKIMSDPELQKGKGFKSIGKEMQMLSLYDKIKNDPNATDDDKKTFMKRLAGLNVANSEDRAFIDNPRILELSNQLKKQNIPGGIDHVQIRGVEEVHFGGWSGIIP